MAHPTCALAHHPDPAPAVQIAGEINALWQARRANTCLRRLAALAQKYRDDEHFVTLTELRALAAVVNTEFKRRLRTLQASIASQST
jgi:hypothetical protein